MESPILIVEVTGIWSIICIKKSLLNRIKQEERFTIVGDNDKRGIDQTLRHNWGWLFTSGIIEIKDKAIIKKVIKRPNNYRFQYYDFESKEIAYETLIHIQSILDRITKWDYTENQM